jgi:hypothetical protein
MPQLNAKLLVADDEIPVGMSLPGVFTELGFSVHAAQGGFSALPEDSSGQAIVATDFSAEARLADADSSWCAEPQFLRRGGRNNAGDESPTATSGGCKHDQASRIQPIQGSWAAGTPTADQDEENPLCGLVR